MIQTGHDPFARQTIRKRTVSGDCSWCGSTNTRGKVFQYYVDADSPRGSGDIKGIFCGIGCLNSYHG